MEFGNNELVVVVVTKDVVLEKNERFKIVSLIIIIIEVSFGLVLSLLLCVSLGLSKSEGTPKTNGEYHLAT